MLANLLYAAMQISDHALEAENFFAIKAQNHAQHAVRRRMLRAHIDDQFVGIKKRLLVGFEIEMRVRSLDVGHSICVFTGRFQYPG